MPTRTVAMTTIGVGPPGKILTGRGGAPGRAPNRQTKNASASCAVTNRMPAVIIVSFS